MQKLNDNELQNVAGGKPSNFRTLCKGVYRNAEGIYIYLSQDYLIVNGLIVNPWPMGWNGTELYYLPYEQPLSLTLGTIAEEYEITDLVYNP